MRLGVIVLFERALSVVPEPLPDAAGRRCTDAMTGPPPPIG
jgi:hypothetical protein